MERIENECVDCGLHCLGSACPYRNVSHYYCDECGQELDPEDMYVADDKDLCEDCLKDMFKYEY